MSDWAELTAEVNKFRDDRDWRQFHNEKDLALSIVLEAAELLESFQWRASDEAVAAERDHISEELADVLIYCLMLADNLGLDVGEIVRAKLAANGEKYPVEKAAGRKAKYTEL